MAASKAKAINVCIGVNVRPLQDQIDEAEWHLREAWKILSELSSIPLEIITPSDESDLEQRVAAESEDSSSQNDSLTQVREMAEEQANLVSQFASTTLKLLGLSKLDSVVGDCQGAI